MVEGIRSLDTDAVMALDFAYSKWLMPVDREVIVCRFREEEGVELKRNYNRLERLEKKVNRLSERLKGVESAIERVEVVLERISYRNTTCTGAPGHHETNERGWGNESGWPQQDDQNEVSPREEV